MKSTSFFFFLSLPASPHDIRGWKTKPGLEVTTGNWKEMSNTKGIQEHEEEAEEKESGS